MTPRGPPREYFIKPDSKLVGCPPLKIKLTSIFVNDQRKAFEFYTKTLGFVKKQDVSAGAYRWLTVVSPEDQSGTQLVLEPNANAASKQYQESIHKQGIPST